MKKQMLLPFAVLFFGLSLVFCSHLVMGQEPSHDKEVKVKIVQKENGDTKIIERIFSAKDEEALKEFLKEYNLDMDADELMGNRQVEISIRKSGDADEDKDVGIEVERQLEKHFGDETPRGFLGVFIESIEDNNKDDKLQPEEKGVRITEVMKESAAEEAGLKEGDIITKVNGNAVTDAQQFKEVIGAMKSGDEVKISYLRENKENKATAILLESKMPLHQMWEDKDFDWQGAMPPMKFHMEMMGKPFLGIVPDESSEDSKQEGVLIGDVVEKSTAEEIGLKKGDVITKINDKPVMNFEELRGAIGEMKAGDAVKVEYLRDGKEMTASAPIKSKAGCEAFCPGFGHGMMPPCIHNFDYDLDNRKEVSKEDLERSVEKLEQEVNHLKEKIDQFDESKIQNDTQQEIKVTITMEDGSTHSLKADNLSFSPNPNNGKFNLSFDLPDKGKTEIRILDVGNKEIYKQTLGNFSGRYENQIDISGNPKGVYFLEITQNNKTLNKKIIIQ